MTQSILCHLLNQAKKTDPRKTGETSRALCPANWLTKSTAFQSDKNQLTTRAMEQFGVFPLFVGSGSLQHDTIDVNCPNVTRPIAVNALRGVMSTTTCAPRWRGRPVANLNGPLVVGLHGDVHVAKFRVHSNRRTSLSAHSARVLTLDDVCPKFHTK